MLTLPSTTLKQFTDITIVQHMITSTLPMKLKLEPLNMDKLETTDTYAKEFPSTFSLIPTLD